MEASASSPTRPSSHCRSASGAQGGLVGEHQFRCCLLSGRESYRRQQVEVRVVGDTVEISQNDKLLRVHEVKHDPVKAHGAFANPGGKASRINAAS